MSPYGQSRFHNTEKLPKESCDDYDKRTWPERLHTDEKGFVFIPGQAFKFCLDSAAKRLGIKIVGKRGGTYTKHFNSGVSVFEPMGLGIKKKDVPFQDLFLNADGVRGSGKRVMRRMPIIQAWEGTVEFMVFDDVITEEIFTQVLKEAGKFIGIGQFRPENGGSNGRFSVEKIKWTSYGD